MALNGQSAELQKAYEACRQIMHRASKNYSFASRLLPNDKRHHVEALYAVLRVGDDRVDVAHDGFTSARAAIEDWRDRYRQALETGDSPHPVLRAYVNTCQVFNIPADVLYPYFRAMIDDLTVQRYPTFADLLHYMDGSAIPVGRAMTHILGSHRPRISDVYPEADALSIAMQLSNFWRDIGQDWHIGRVYVPQEDLENYGYTEADIAAARVNDRLIDLLEFEFARTDTYYERARNGVMWLASGQWGVMSALEIYRGIKDAIYRNAYDVFNHRAELSKWQKIAVVIKARWQTMHADFRKPQVASEHFASGQNVPDR